MLFCRKRQSNFNNWYTLQVDHRLSGNLGSEALPDYRFFRIIGGTFFDLKSEKTSRPFADFRQKKVIWVMFQRWTTLVHRCVGGNLCFYTENRIKSSARLSFKKLYYSTSRRHKGWIGNIAVWRGNTAEEKRNIVRRQQQEWQGYHQQEV